MGIAKKIEIETISILLNNLVITYTQNGLPDAICHPLKADADDQTIVALAKELFERIKK